MSEKPLRGPDSPENPHAGQGAVMLDIGGDVGAVVVTVPLAMVGSEVDIVAVADLVAEPEPEPGHGQGHGHGHGHRTHVAAIRRPVAVGGEVASLVFAEVVAGRYALLPKGTDRVAVQVDVEGGRVTEIDWPVGPQA